MVMGTPDDEPQEVDLHISVLLGTSKQAMGARELLGDIAARCLKGAGRVAFMLDEEGVVRWVNPTQVLLLDGALDDQPDRPFRWVRPALGDGQPTFVAFRNGELWEIEFEEDHEEPEEAAGG